MDLNKTLHRISLLKWVFAVWIVALLVLTFSDLGNIKLSTISNLIFLSGIYLGLESLTDVKRMSEKEISQFREKGLAKIQTYTIFGGMVLLMLVSMLFFLVGQLFPNMSEGMVSEFRNLAYGCIAMMLGFICLLKHVMDKQEHARDQEKIHRDH